MIIIQDNSNLRNENNLFQVIPYNGGMYILFFRSIYLDLSQIIPKKANFFIILKNVSDTLETTHDQIFDKVKVYPHHIVYSQPSVLVLQIQWLHVESSVKRAAIFYPENKQFGQQLSLGRVLLVVCSWLDWIGHIQLPFNKTTSRTTQYFLIFQLSAHLKLKLFSNFLLFSHWKF